MSKNLSEERLAAVRGALLGGHPTPDGEVASGGLPLRRLVHAVFRARWLIALLTGSGAAVGTFLAVSTPNSYLSEGKFLLTGSGSETIAIDAYQATDAAARTTDYISSAANHVLMSNELLGRVIDRLTPARILAPYRPEEVGTGLTGILHAWQMHLSSSLEGPVSSDAALMCLQRSLGVARQPMTSVLVVSYLANDRALAQEVLATYMEEAKKWHQELYDDPKAHQQIEARAVAAEHAVDAAQAKLRDFLDNTARVSSPFEFELEQARRQEGEAASALRNNESTLAAARTQLQALRAKLEGLPATITVRRQPDSLAEAKAFDEEIGRLRAQRARIGVEREGAPELQSIDRMIQKLEDEQRKALRRQAEADPIEVQEVNPEYTAARAEIAVIENTIVKAAAIQPQLQEFHGAASRRLGHLLDLEPTFQELRQEAIRSEQALQRAKDSLALSQRKRELHLGNYSLLKMVEGASLPLEKEGPNRLKLILGGLFVGLFGALGLVLIRALPDSVVRTRGDLEALDGTNVIGVIPRLDRKNLRRHVVLRIHGW